MKPTLVIDASITLAWSLEDEHEGVADAALAYVRENGAIAPTLWSYEVANVLALLIRRKRIDAARAADIGTALDALGIETIPPRTRHWRPTTLALATQHALTAYDAAYLRLALDADAKLATLDHALHAAAASYGIAFS